MWCRLRTVIIRTNLYSLKPSQENTIYLGEKGTELKRKEKKEY